MPHALRCRKSVLLLAVLGGLPATAAAVEPLDTFNITIGGYVSRFDTEVRADGDLLDGTSIDLGRDLGMDKDNTIAFAGLSWRPFDRHEIGLSYYTTDAEASHRLDRDIVFDDTVYQASATIRGNYEVDRLEAYYTWWGMSSENWALGPRLGLTWYRMELGVALELGADGQPVGSNSFEETVRADLPAPTLGASWRWTPAEDWRISADAGWFSTEINGIDGDVTYVRLGAEWHPWERVGVMLDYTLSNIDAHADRDSFSGRLDFRNSGIRVGVMYRY
ncbi:hypothetical protein ACW5EG_01040 [Luteimonas sp. A611]